MANAADDDNNLDLTTMLVTGVPGLQFREDGSFTLSATEDQARTTLIFTYMSYDGQGPGAEPEVVIEVLDDDSGSSCRSTPTVGSGLTWGLLGLVLAGRRRKSIS